jgi:hypothetical protein
MAIPPVFAKGDPPDAETVTVRPDTVADAWVSGVDDVDGPVGLPLPHPAASPAARMAADLPQEAQNSLRVGVARSFDSCMCHLIRSWGCSAEG